MKKKKFAHLCTEVLHVLVLILLFGMTSCIQEDNIVPEVSVPDGYVNYFVEDLSFSCSAGEAKVPFQINVDWSMEIVAPESTSASWLSVEPASGAAGLHKVMVRVTDNDTYEARSGKIHLMCGTAKVAEIVVTQPSVTPEVSVPDGYVNYFVEDLSFSCSAGEAEVPFLINVDWSMEVVVEDGGSASWCSVEPALGKAGLHIVTVRVSENNDYSPRSAKIHLLCNSSKVAEIVVNQKPIYGEQPIYGKLRFTTESPSKITLDNQGSFGPSNRCNPGDSVTVFMQVSYTGAYITEADYSWKLHVSSDSVFSEVIKVIAPHKQNTPPIWRFKAPDVAGDYTVTFKAKYDYSAQTEVGQIYGESSRSTGTLEVR